jgi:hypothetical protein
MSGGSGSGPGLPLRRAIQRTVAQRQLPANQFYLLLPIYVVAVAAISMPVAALIGKVLTNVLPLSADTITVGLMVVAVLVVGWNAEGAIDRLDLPGRFGFRVRKASIHH